MAMIDLIVVLLLLFLLPVPYRFFKFYVPYSKRLISPYICTRPVSGDIYIECNYNPTLKLFVKHIVTNIVQNHATISDSAS